MAIMQITVIPLGTTTPGVGAYIVEVQRFLQKQGIPFTLTDMGTIISGETNELFDIAKTIHQIPFSIGLERLVTNITIDDRRDKRRTLGEKREAVLQRLREYEK